MKPTSLTVFWFTFVLTLWISFSGLPTRVFGTGAAEAQTQSPAQLKRMQSIECFNQAAKVLQHPRCLNCHVPGDEPTQGMDLHAHMMNVQRGSQDHGAVAMQCAACHGTQNNVSSGVPGAPKWALAPKSMNWQKLSRGDLCRKVRGEFPKGNFSGNKTKDEFIHHSADDPLVAWGWNPGPGREPAPGTQTEFGRTIAQWIDTGAECPQ